MATANKGTAKSPGTHTQRDFEVGSVQEHEVPSFRLVPKNILSWRSWKSWIETDTELTPPEKGQRSWNTGNWCFLPENNFSFKSWLKWLEVSETAGLSLRQQFVFNYDLKPVEESRRKWRWWHYMNFWLSEAIQISTLETAGSYMGDGMTWWLCWISIWLGYTLSAILTVLIQRIGSHYHISFPVGCRASWGIYGSIWPVICRIILACIWWGTQSYNLGICVQLIIRSIFGNDTLNIGSTDLNGGTLTTFQFVCFFLGWLIQLPFLWFPIQSMRHFFTAKAILAPIAAFGLMIWSLVKADGAGPLMNGSVTGSSATVGWVFMQSVMSGLSTQSALILNTMDFSRFACRPSDATWAQFLTMPFSFAITSLLGILIASAATGIYPNNNEDLWNPLNVVGNYMSENTAGDRAGVFFVGLGLAICQIGGNLSSNSASAGTDLTALLPRFINIRRGQYLCAIIGFAICPWNFFVTSSSFLENITSYSVFLSPIAGILICDYFLFRRGKLYLEELYNAEPNSTYMYGNYGINWRSMVAFLMGVVPNLPGMKVSIGGGSPENAKYVYYVNYFVGFLVAFSFYWLLMVVRSPQNVDEGISRSLCFRGKWQEDPNAYVDDFEEYFRGKEISKRKNQILVRVC